MNKNNILFVILAYTFFWGLIAIGLVLLLAGVLPGEETPINITVTICSWTPTIALLVLFKKLYPGSSVKGFYQNAFKERLNIALVLTVVIVQVLIVVAAACLVAYSEKTSLRGLFDFSFSTIGAGFLWSLVQGATGEESGWRGFLQPSIEKKSGVINSSLIVGVIWGFWHAPLWFATSGFAGKELLQYIACFMLMVVSVAIIIGICYNRCRNLFIPILIHFMFNFLFKMFTGELLGFFTRVVVFYALAAIGYIVWHKRKIKRKQEIFKENSVNIANNDL